MVLMVDVSVMAVTWQVSGVAPASDTMGEEVFSTTVAVAILLQPLGPVTVST